jgi:hypothetical protein
MVVYDSGIILRSSARHRARRGGGIVVGGVVEDGISCGARGEEVVGSYLNKF